VFTAKLNVAKGSTFAGGVLKIRDNNAILMSVVGHAAAWVTSVTADVIDVSNRSAVFFMAVAPAGAKGPSSHEEFWSIPGRRLVALGPDTPHGMVSPLLPKALSYKVAGCTPEEQPMALLVFGVMLSVAPTKDAGENFFFGVRAALRQGKAGFTPGTEEIVEQPTPP